MVKLRNSTSSHKTKMLRSRCIKKIKLKDSLKRSKPTKRILQSSIKKLPVSSKNQISAGLKSRVSKRITTKATIDSMSASVNQASNKMNNGPSNQNYSKRFSRVPALRNSLPAKNVGSSLPSMNRTAVCDKDSSVAVARRTSVSKKTYIESEKTLKRKSQNISVAKSPKEFINKPVNRTSAHKKLPLAVVVNQKLSNAKKMSNNNIKPDKAKFESNSFSKNVTKCVMSSVNQKYVPKKVSSVVAKNQKDVKKKSCAENKEKDKLSSLAKNAGKLFLSVADKIMIKTKALLVNSEETFKTEPSVLSAYENSISDLQGIKHIESLTTPVVNQILLIPADKILLSKNKTDAFPSNVESSTIMRNRKSLPILKEACASKRKSLDSSDNHTCIKKRKTSISDNQKSIKRSLSISSNNPSSSLSVNNEFENKNSPSFLYSAKKTVTNNNLKLLPKKTRNLVKKLSVSFNKPSSVSNTKSFPTDKLRLETKKSSSKPISSSTSSRVPSMVDDYNKYLETVPIDDLSLLWRSQTPNSKSSGKTSNHKCISVKRGNIRSCRNTSKQESLITEKDHSDYEDDLYDPKKFEKFKDLLKYTSDSEFDYDISTQLGITLVQMQKGHPEPNEDPQSSVQIQKESSELMDCPQPLVQRQKETPEINDCFRPTDDALPKNEESLPNRKRDKKISEFFKKVKRKTSLKKKKKLIRRNKSSTNMKTAESPKKKLKSSKDICAFV